MCFSMVGQKFSLCFDNYYAFHTSILFCYGLLFFLYSTAVVCVCVMLFYV